MSKTTARILLGITLGIIYVGLFWIVPFQARPEDQWKIIISLHGAVFLGSVIFVWLSYLISKLY